ncbi:MAG: hypothetical protein NTY07_07560 [Bacteroidia bacterium]|nr:hypothetical protein [Bacteroidia bacterium]
MENIDLKTMWQKAHIKSQQNIGENSNIEEVIKMNHSKTIAKVLYDIKLKIILYSMFLTIFIGLMLYAFVYLELNLAASSILTFSVVGLFLLVQITSEINRLLVLAKNADNLSVRESVIYFLKKLNRIKTFDFLSYLVLLYLAAVWIIRCYIQDIGGVKNLSGTNEFQSLILIVIPILLLTPWLIKYQNNQRYKKTYSDLNDSRNLLDDES